MALGTLLGAAFEAFGPRLLRQGAKEGIESGLSRKAAGLVANRITNYTSTKAGQRLVARAAGQRFATRLAEHEGTQTAARWAIKKSTNQRIQGEGDFAPAEKPKIVHAAAESTVPKSVNDPSQMNIVQSQTDPVVQQYRTNNRLASGGQPRNQRELQMQQAAQRRRGSPATGYMGTGKGWWEQNDQVTQKGAFAGDVSQLGDFSVARGPTKWAHPLGKGLATGTVARGVGFLEGYKSVSNAPEPAYDAVNSAGVPSRNAELTEPSSHLSALYQPQSTEQSTPVPGRQESFSAGSTGVTPQQPTVGTTPADTPKKPRKAAQYRLPGVDWKTTLNP